MPNGSGFPGEPAWYHYTNYTSINGSFGKSYGFGKFAESAEGWLDPAILNSMVPGTGTGDTKVWGVFSTSGMDQYMSSVILQNEASIIRAVKGRNADVNAYRIIWYVIKYQTDTYWHIDGIIVDKATYNVNYYGNGNTSGNAPTGSTGLPENSVYTVLGNTGNLENVRNGNRYEFLGWNTRADGTGTHYAPGQNITITGDISLYAQWKAPSKSITVTKVWEDNNNSDNIRPDSVTVHLLQNDVHSGNPLTLSAAGNWTGTWYDVPILDQYGNEIDYMVEESTYPGYNHTVSGNANDGFILTNTHIPETVTFEVQKVWDDDNNRDNTRPASISVQLYKSYGDSGEIAVGSPVSLDAAGSWAYMWQGLPKYENGNALVYSVREIVPQGYSVSYSFDQETNRHVIKNSYTPEMLEITAVKQWHDSNNQDNIRPAAGVTLSLYASGVNTGISDVATAENNWTVSFTGLPKNWNGQTIVYSVVEEKVPTGYTLVQNGYAENNYTVINSHTPETVSFVVNKVWDDNNDQDGIRPDSVTVRVLADGVLVRELDIEAEELWAVRVDDLPKYANGREIVYTISELSLEGYESAITGDIVNGFIVTNTHTPYFTSRTVQKVWDDNDDNAGMRPASVQVTLYENGSPSTREGSVVTLDASNNWQAVWDNLPVNSNGTAISYTVVETGYTDDNGTHTGIPADYTASYSYDQVNHVDTVVNTYDPETITLNIQKSWQDQDNQDGIRPESVTVYLCYRLTDIAGRETVLTTRSRELSAANEWEASFTDLPKYAFGAPVEYSVLELPVDGYTTEYSAVSAANVITVTNYHVPEKTSVEVTKLWDDADNRDGIRPDSVTMTLYADGVSTGRMMTLDESTGWKAAFTGLDRYFRGREIVYSVVENELSGYTPSYDHSTSYLPSDPAAATVDGSVSAAALTSITVTNTHQPELFNLYVSKTWDDDDDRDGIRPDEVTIHLFADGVEIATLPLNASNNWRGFFTVPRFRPGQIASAIEYSVSETALLNGVSVITGDASTGYAATISGSAETGFAITNTHTPAKISLSATKVWNDMDDKDQVRPDSVTVHLMVEGEHLGTAYAATLSEANGWSHTWNDLYLYEEGDIVNYTVYEEPVGDGYVPDYKRVGNSVIITNSRETDKVSFTVQKVWSDDNNLDNLRPASIAVRLFADDVPVEDVTLTAQDHWRYVWTGLEKNNAEGNAVDYRVEELTVVEGYELSPSVDQTTGIHVITNHHSSATVSYGVQKVWDDAQDQDGHRPDSVEVILYRNGIEFERKTLSAENGWACVWDKLPKHHGIGLPNVYTVQEQSIDGYTASYDVVAYDDGSQFLTITNSHQPETTGFVVNKQWVDENDQDGLRPESITLTVYADGIACTTLTLNASDAWKAEVSGLPKYNAGREIVYTVEENILPGGYQSSGTASAANGFTIVNTHLPKTIDLRVNKVWEDFNDNDGARPWQVEITLLDNGQPIPGIEALKLNSENGWTGVWTDMPRFRSGQYVNYSVIETAYWATEDGQRIDGLPPKYSVTHSYSERSPSADESIATVTNKYTPETTGINVQKIWDDADNRDGIRPESITVWLWYKLPGEGSQWVKTDRNAVMSAANEWDVDFIGLQKYYNRGLITYNVSEDPVEGYEEAVYTANADLSLVTITNTHNTATTTVSVNKVWDDANDQDGIRPESVELTLYANGVSTGQTAVLSESTGWECSFENLPLNSMGSPIKYRVYETAAEGYRVEYTGSKNEAGTQISITVTNVHEPETITIPVSKVWDDNGDQDGMRPDKVEVVLCVGDDELETIELIPGTNWSGSFTDLPKYSDGEIIDYSVTEIVPEGYTANVEELDEGGFRIVNTHSVEKVEVKAIKIWDDNNDSDGKRPESITLHLLANGEHTGEANKRVLTAAENGQSDGSWVCTWTLDKYMSGQIIDYTVYEEPVMFRPVSSAAEGQEDENAPELHIVDRYEPSYAHDTENNVITITNTYVPETVDISVHKVWIDGDNRDGIRPEEVTVQLCRKDGNEFTVLEEIVLNDGNNWLASWNMPKYENSGTPIVYWIVEPDTYSGYENSVNQETEYDSGFFILTSVHDPLVTGISVEKIWNDEEDNDGKRPDGIIVQLYANNVPLANGRVILGQENNWAVSWQSTLDYPLYVYEKGERIIYTVGEVGYVIDGVEYQGLPAGYTSGVSNSGGNAYSLVITNTKATEKISVSILKIWDDSNNNDGLRPESVSVSLLKNGQQLGEKYVLSKDNNWSVTVEGLYRYSGGVLVEYTVVEDAVSEYSASYTSSTDSSGNVLLTVVNKHQPYTRLCAVSKVWRDGNNIERLRPGHVMVQLYKNGTAYGEPIRLESANNWMQQLSLPVYENGILLDWKVMELYIPRYYNVSYDQTNLTVINTIQSRMVPKTGDYNDFLPWILMFAVCVSSSAALLLSDRKKCRKKK